MNFIHSRAVREKNTGKLVFELTSTLQIVLGMPTAWLEILSVENFPKGVRRLSWLGSACPGLLHQGSPIAELQLEVEVLPSLPSCASRWVASTLPSLVFIVWWQVSQSCWWSVTLEDRYTDLCLGFLSYPGEAGQVRSEVPLLIQPPKMKVAM